MKRVVFTLATGGVCAALAIGIFAAGAHAQVNSSQVVPPGGVIPPATPGAAPADQPAGGMPAEQPPAPGASGAAEAGGPAPIRQISAQAAESADADRALIDEATRLLKLKRYAEAAPKFDMLRKKYDPLEYQVSYALCLYETGKNEEAREIYEKVLQLDPDNILALLSIARINTKFAQAEADRAKKDELVDRAREALKRAARNGANCLRAIRTYPEFERFRTEVTLEIALIKEPQHLIAGIGKDPFHNPLPRVGEPSAARQPGLDDKGGERWSVEKQREQVKRCRDLIAQIDGLLKKNDFEGIARVWLQIEDIIRDEKKIQSLDVIAELNALKNVVEGKKAIVKSLLLKAYFAQGERLVAQMETDFEQQAYNKVFEGWESLNAHTKRMVQTDAGFATAADDLKKRGQEWYDKAKILEEIGKIKFDITGIVAGASVAKAIVNNRVLSENDLVYDQRGNPIADLRVAAIKKRRVRFLYKGLEFERPLLGGPK
jgi:urease gamma subunit